jgi:hypothetical protein
MPVNRQTGGIIASIWIRYLRKSWWQQASQWKRQALSPLDGNVPNQARTMNAPNTVKPSGFSRLGRLFESLSTFADEHLSKSH